MPPRAIKHQLTCPFEVTSGSFLIGRRRILVIPRNHLEAGHPKKGAKKSFAPGSTIKSRGWIRNWNDHVLNVPDHHIYFGSLQGIFQLFAALITVFFSLQDLNIVCAIA